MTSKRLPLISIKTNSKHIRRAVFLTTLSFITILPALGSEECSAILESEKFKDSPEITIKNENTFVIKNPKHPGSQLPFGSNSSEIGVCRALGYDSGLPGSQKLSYFPYSALSVDDSGKVVSGAGLGFLYQKVYKEVICLGDSLAHPLEKSTRVQNPRESKTGLPFAAGNSPWISDRYPVVSEDGICKNLGFDRGATSSIRPSFFEHRGVRVNETNGKVAAVVTETVAESIICISSQ